MNAMSQPKSRLIAAAAPHSAFNDAAEKQINRPTIPMRLEQQEKRISDLHGAISNLETKCSSLVEPRPENPCSQEACPTPNTIISLIEHNNEHIEAAVARLCALLDRLLL